ncbi:MAG TPA: hypothetical protein VK439_03765, partial [Rubrivivax sp.]|nr:hypothetical protein [Rubrivivax sp.]
MRHALEGAALAQFRQVEPGAEMVTFAVMITGASAGLTQTVCSCATSASLIALRLAGRLRRTWTSATAVWMRSSGSSASKTSTGANVRLMALVKEFTIFNEITETGAGKYPGSTVAIPRAVRRIVSSRQCRGRWHIDTHRKYMRLYTSTPTSARRVCHEP